jgi:hypothetical protein
MLGVTKYEGEGPADTLLRELAEEWGVPETYSTTRVGVFFGEPGKTVPDPYFGGDGPPRAGCIRCGACMVDCRHNAKNTLPKKRSPRASIPTPTPTSRTSPTAPARTRSRSCSPSSARPAASSPARCGR